MSNCNLPTTCTLLLNRKSGRSTFPSAYQTAESYSTDREKRQKGLQQFSRNVLFVPTTPPICCCWAFLGCCYLITTNLKMGIRQFHFIFPHAHNMYMCIVHFTMRPRSPPERHSERACQNKTWAHERDMIAYSKGVWSSMFCRVNQQFHSRRGRCRDARKKVHPFRPPGCTLRKDKGVRYRGRQIEAQNGTIKQKEWEHWKRCVPIAQT